MDWSVSAAVPGSRRLAPCSRLGRVPSRHRRGWSGDVGTIRKPAVETHLVELTPEEYAQLNAGCPESAGSGPIGRRAEAIVRLHLRRLHPTCEFQSPDPGADLKVALGDGSPALLIEIKGTASVGIAWPQLKVSSRNSHRLLVEAGIPVYRVSEVFSQSPSIYVLNHGTDFLLAPEVRWTFRPVARTIVPHETLTSRPSSESVGSKYDPLRHHLQAQVLDRVTRR